MARGSPRRSEPRRGTTTPSVEAGRCATCARPPVGQRGRSDFSAEVTPSLSTRWTRCHRVTAWHWRPRLRGWPPPSRQHVAFLSRAAFHDTRHPSVRSCSRRPGAGGAAHSTRQPGSEIRRKSRRWSLPSETAASPADGTGSRTPNARSGRKKSRVHRVGRRCSTRRERSSVARRRAR